MDRKTWTSDDLAEAVGLQDYAAKRQIGTVLRDAVRRGEIERVGPSEFRTALVKREPLGKDKMWRILRMRRRITSDELAELAAVGRKYAQEYLRSLVRAEIVRKNGNAYELTHDSVSAPPVDDNAAKLRQLRAKRKAALEALMKAREALEVARAELMD
jgi:hypothetical protein